MKIGIDISQIIFEGTGVGRFTKGLVNSIIEDNMNHEWIFLFSSLRRHLDNSVIKNCRTKNIQIISWKYPPTALSFLWNQLHIFPIDRSIKHLDWFISSDWTEPPASIKKATIVHDLTFLRYPETVDVSIRKTQTLRLKWVTRESKVIFTDSLSTKKDLQHYFHTDSKRISVVYPGITTQKPSREKIEIVKKRYDLSQPFILAVGKIEPRKNMERLIKAYLRLNQKKVNLIIAGSKGWGSQKFDQLPPTIRFLGYVDDDELMCLYKLSLFFVYPSIWEGFGYPPLEAMSLSCSVAMSNTSSLPEIGDKAALYFNPFDSLNMSKALDKMMSDNLLRTELAAKGFIKSQEFTWKNYLKNFVKTLEAA